MKYGIIYCARNLKNGKRYIGLTKESLQKRKLRHLNLAFTKHSTVAFHCALRKYGADAFEWSILEVCCSRVCIEHAERFWIANHTSMVPLGYNMTDGGEGGHGKGRSPSLETRQRIADSLRGRKGPRAGIKLSDEMRAKLSLAHIGKRPSEETRRRMSEAQRSITLEQKAARAIIFDKQRAAPVTAETREKLSAANTGRRPSAETLEKLRTSHLGHPAWNKGTPWGADVRLKLSIANKGKILSAETRARMSAAQKRRSAIVGVVEEGQ